METNKKSGAMENITLKPVPMEERKPWTNIAFIWAGSVICIPALMVGSFITAGMKYGQACACMAIGYIIVVAYMCLMGIQSADLGLPATVAVSRAYGKRGSSFLVSLVIALCMTGWFAQQLALCAGSFCSIMAASFNINFPYRLSVLIWGVAMFITAVYGVKLIAILNKISVPALFIMLIWGLIASLMKGAAASIANYHPEAYLGWVYGITMSVAGFATGAVCCGVYTRYCRNRKETVLSCAVGVLPAGILALAIGGFLAIAAGSYDLSAIFASFGLPLLGMLVLILATWTTNTGNAYSSGISICNMFKLEDHMRKWMTLLAGVIGTLLAILGFENVFGSFLNYIAALVPAIAGVAIADYWIMGKGKPELWKEKEGINWLGVISWLAGFAVANWTTFLIPTINGIIAALVVYCVLASVVKNPSINPIYEMQLELKNKE